MEDTGSDPGAEIADIEQTMRSDFRAYLKSLET